MPTVARVGSYRLFFYYASDRHEPAHVHVERDRKVAKLWVKPVRVQERDGFSVKEIKRICRLVVAREQEIIEAWHEFFGN